MDISFWKALWKHGFRRVETLEIAETVVRRDRDMRIAAQVVRAESSVASATDNLAQEQIELAKWQRLLAKTNLRCTNVSIIDR